MSIKLAFCILCCSEEEKEPKPNQPITKFNEVDGEQNLNMKGISTPDINKIRDDDIIVVNPMNNSNANDRGSASDDSSGGFESVDIEST